ncbi:acyl-CoA-binding protein [Taibaiella chishuiensis]|uniref:Acyl-CoA-binding protein n=1 Tax=Taibaiella chishuiensis TaxID=1434707 RepID=A0A2P8D5I0_9BACT|nr:acyl-CoA-binding protein [Taibaiella chishuiensis]PSK92475.1 acyl-CoA-binding protein [Taibaiella chishuiensis]
MSLTEQFEAAVAGSKTLPAKPDNDTLLKLYSLFKQAQEGDAPEKGDYGMFDFVAKAKHDAWAQLKGLGKEAAMQQYVDLVARLKG